MEATNVVFIFHSVNSKDWFQRAVKMINQMYKVVSMEELDSYFYGTGRLENACHISFDDGDRSTYENAFPVLKEMSLPASLFISPQVIKQKCNYWFQEMAYITDHEGDVLLKRTVSQMFNVRYSKLRKFKIASILKQLKLEQILKIIDEVKNAYNLNIKTKYNMTVDQVLELRKSNLFTIGAHTMRHPILRNEDDQIVEKEICESIYDLSKMINEKVKYFAYPNGRSRLDFGKREIGILKKLKVRLAFSTDQKLFDRKTNPLSIPRTGLSEESQATLFDQVVLAPKLMTFKNLNLRLEPKTKERIEIMKNRILPRTRYSHGVQK